MKSLLVMVAAAAVLAGTSAAAQDAGAGRKIYDSKQCAKCHMIAGKGNKIGPLDGVAGKISAGDLRKWLTSPVEMEKALTKKPKVKMSSKIQQLNLKPADIDALVAYLVTLK